MDIEHRILQVNRLLANMFVLYTKLHRYRWYVKGEQAIMLKHWFKQYEFNYKQHINDLAKLILSLEGQPFATLEKYVKETTLQEATADDETKEIVNQLIEDTTHILQEINDLLNTNKGDGTFRMFVQTIQPLEQTLLNMQHECKQFLK